MELRRICVSASACLGLTVSWAAAARGAVFSIDPVSVALRRGQTSQILTLHNNGDVAVRFQLNVFAWSEDKDGKMTLTPSQELVVFPSLFALDDNATRRIRVGTLATPENVEKTFRLVVEELPSEVENSLEVQNSVRVLTHVSIPIFLQPNNPAPALRIDSLAVREGTVFLDVRNAGNAHLRIQNIQFTGDSTGHPGTFRQEIRGWYLLGRSQRSYQIPLAPDVCESLGQVSAVVKTSDQELHMVHPVSHEDCRKR
jgi:fimbrial chaperone protein